MDKYILLVEDSEDDADLTQLVLRRTGVRNRVVLAKDGVEAIDLIFGAASSCRGASDLPAFVLLDLKLPKVDGFEVLRRIREDAKTRFIPVVVFTSSKEEKDVSRAYELAANSYVRKPVEFSALGEAVGQIGRYWLDLNISPDLEAGR